MTHGHAGRDTGPPMPRWNLGGQTWLFVGDEVDLADRGADAYGRVIGPDPGGSGDPIVLILAGNGRGTQQPMPLASIAGKRDPADAATRAGGREDRLWSGGLRDDSGRGWL